MTNHELQIQLEKLVREERRLTGEILHLINIALERRAYLELGFSSMFDWLVKGFGYSNAAAYRRIESARLLKAVPEIAGKLADGQVNLSTLSKAQSVIKAQEKCSGQKVSPQAKREIVQKIENKSALEAEQVLFAVFPETKSLVHQEKRTAIDEHTTRHSMNLKNEAAADLKRAKEVLSHKFPEASDSDIVTYALKFLLDHIDPLRKAPSAAEAKRVTKSAVKRVTLQSSGGACTFKDPVTGQVCGSRYQIQSDHIIPKALGGSDEPENLRPLCRRHNILMAERVFGVEHMRKFRTLD